MKKPIERARAALVAAGWAMLAVPAWAQATMPAAPAAMPTGILNLSASATAEVPNDLMSLTWSVTREGTEAQAVQATLKQALDAALAEARRVAKPGLIDVQTGGFSLQPRYGQRGSITGWQGTAELTASGRDMTGIAQLAGRIGTMTVSRVGYGLSREQREKTEQELVGRAIAQFRARAEAQSKLFGYNGYTVREVSVGTNEPPPVDVSPMLRRGVQAMAEAAPLPTEAGNGSVTASVNGSVQMTR